MGSQLQSSQNSLTGNTQMMQTQLALQRQSATNDQRQANRHSSRFIYGGNHAEFDEYHDDAMPSIAHYRPAHLNTIGFSHPEFHQNTQTQALPFSNDHLQTQSLSQSVQQYHQLSSSTRNQYSYHNMIFSNAQPTDQEHSTTAGTTTGALRDRHSVPTLSSISMESQSQTSYPELHAAASEPQLLSLQPLALKPSDINRDSDKKLDSHGDKSVEVSESDDNFVPKSESHDPHQMSIEMTSFSRHE